MIIGKTRNTVLWIGAGFIGTLFPTIAGRVFFNDYGFWERLLWMSIVGGLGGGLYYLALNIIYKIADRRYLDKNSYL